jgi:hypothetical protein
MGCDACSEESNEACTERCKADLKCGCAYYEPERKLCTLMWGGSAFANKTGQLDSDACIVNRWNVTDSMHHESREGRQNTVNEVCCHDCAPEEDTYAEDGSIGVYNGIGE